MNQSQNLIDGFTRQECLKLTGCTSNRLFYLEKVGLIVPTRVGNNARPTVIFSWEQLLEIRAIKNLRQDVSLQTVRKIIEFLNQCGYDDSLTSKHLVVADDKDVFWVDPDWSDFQYHVPSALKVAGKRGKGVGQIVLLVIPPLTEIVDQIWEVAKEPEVLKVVNFEEFKRRAKTKPTWDVG